MSRLWRQDLAWAGLILGVALLLGLMQQWELVHRSWRGELAARLAQARDQRRQQEFQGVKTINLAQAYARFQQGQTRFIDARPAEEFAELHIPKALNLTPEMAAAGVRRESGRLRQGPGNRGVLRPGELRPGFEGGGKTPGAGIYPGNGLCRGIPGLG